jgi:hypothetical protein
LPFFVAAGTLQTFTALGLTSVARFSQAQPSTDFVHFANVAGLAWNVPCLCMVILAVRLGGSPMRFRHGFVVFQLAHKLTRMSGSAPELRHRIRRGELGDYLGCAPGRLALQFLAHFYLDD